MSQSRIPPGPKGLLSFPKRFFEYIVDPLSYLTRLARRFGDVVYLPTPGFQFYMFNHPSDIEEILRHQHRLFKKDAYAESLRPILGNGLLTSEGDVWRRQRMMAQPAFQARQIQQYAATMAESAERTIAGWRPGEVRDIHAEMMRLTLEIVTKTLFDAELADETHSVGKDLAAAMEYYANPIAIFPWWRHVPTPQNLRFRRALPRLNRVVFDMIRQRRGAGVGDRVDLLSRLLAARDESGRGMSDEELRDQLMTLFLAGHETTALTMSYTFYLLSKNPDVESSLIAELACVLKGRTPTVEDVGELPYTEWVIKESMRLYPPAWTIGREAIEDCEIAGYRVPKGAQILMAQWVVHRDPRFWPEPERFNPSRWGEDRIKDLPRCAYFPFGDGPRVCIGNSFAMTEAVLLLATIAQRVRLELVRGKALRLVPSVTLRPRDGIAMVVHAREPQQSVRNEEWATKAGP